MLSFFEVRDLCNCTFRAFPQLEPCTTAAGAATMFMLSDVAMALADNALQNIATVMIEPLTRYLLNGTP
jgi:hypothetical protein